MTTTSPPRSPHLSLPSLTSPTERATHPDRFHLPGTTEPTALVIFGIAGSLSRRKLLPAIYDLANRGLLPPDFFLIGMDRPTAEHTDFVLPMLDAVTTHARTPLRERTWRWLRDRFRFIPGDFGQETPFITLKETIASAERRNGIPAHHVYYLSTPPSCYAPVAEQLRRHGLADARGGARSLLIAEKPFGYDLASARALATALRRAFPGGRILCTDHYLGKEALRNITALRFGNTVFEPLWNRRHVDHVQITLAEDEGIGGRAEYYDGAGAARDTMQNHLMQLLALTAMDEPRTFDHDTVSAEKTKVLRAVRLPSDLDTYAVRGQYTRGRQHAAPVPGYQQEEGVAPGSTTETFAALKVEIDNQRWAGVPFYLRTGKRLRQRVTEISLVFKNAPTAFTGESHRNPPNVLSLQVQPRQGVELRFGVKVPGSTTDIQDVTMGFDYGESTLPPVPGEYESLIADVLRGDTTLFPSRPEIEHSWRIIDAAREHWSRRGRPEPYAPGTWGPAAAERMLRSDGRAWLRSGTDTSGDQRPPSAPRSP